MSDRTPFVVGNWKMNTNRTAAVELAQAVAAGVNAGAATQVGVCPPFPYIDAVATALCDRSSNVLVGAQDLYHEPNGAFTGEVSTDMLKDVGCRIVLTGHSERRHVLGETDELVNRKTLAAVRAGLHCILCVGETLEQREAGQTDDVNQRQTRAGLAGLTADDAPSITIAYEPVWAIGTGKTATPDDAQDAHRKIRSLLADILSPEAAASIRIQYGGSVKPDNAAELFAQPDIDGGLIGGASLKPDAFLAIVNAA